MPCQPPFLGLSLPGEQAKQQLGTFLAVFAWLLRVGGWAELATGVEAHLAVVPISGGAHRPAPRPRSREVRGTNGAKSVDFFRSEVKCLGRSNMLAVNKC